MSEFDEKVKTVTVSKNTSVGLFVAAVLYYICFFVTGLSFLIMAVSNGTTENNLIAPAFILWIAGFLSGTILIALSKMDVEEHFSVKKRFFNILVFSHINCTFFALIPYVAFTNGVVFVNYMDIGLYLLIFVALLQVFSLGFICEQLILSNNKRYSPANFIISIIAGVVTFGIEIFFMVFLILFVIFGYSGNILLDMLPGLIVGFFAFGFSVVEIIFSIILIINVSVRNRRKQNNIQNII